MQPDGTWKPPSILLFALLCFLAAEVGRLSPITPIAGLHLTILWIPVGMVAGALAITAPRQWLPLLASGGVAIAASLLLHAGPVVAAIAFSVIYVSEAALTAWMLRRIVGDEFDLSRLPHIMTLFLAGAAGPLAGGLVAALAAAVIDPSAPHGLTWLAWSVTDALGTLIGATLVLGWRQYPDTIASPPRWRLVEAIAIMAAVMLTARGVFGGDFPEVLRAPAFMLPFFFLAVFRFGPFGAAASLAGALAVGMPSTAVGHGPFMTPGATLLTGILRAQLVSVMSAMSFLLLATVVAERRRIARERSKLIADLQQALIEIKTLRGFIPICAWCHKVRDDAGFWQEIESYLQAHTDVVVSHGICPSCSEREHRAIEAHTTDHA